MARNRTANISGELITNTIIVTSTGANVSNALVKTGDTMTGELNVANNLVVTGNVGIGTANPTVSLDVAGSIRTAPYGYLGFGSGDNYIEGDNANNIVRIGTNNITRIEIIENGNVGIGTPNPSQKLQVVGNVTLSGGDRYILGDGGDLYIDTENVSGRDLLLQTQSGQKVGIGTTTPAQKLDVIGKMRITDDIIMSQAQPRIDYDGGVDGALRFLSTSTGAERMRITSNGNVGIGVITPQKTLHIEHTAGASEGILISGASDTVGHTAGILLRAEGGEADSVFRAKGAIFLERVEGVYGVGKLHLCNDIASDNDPVTVADAKLTINENGNVGIATISPNSRLTIANPTSATTSNYGDGANSAINITIPNIVGRIGQITFTNAAAPDFGYAAIGVEMTSGTAVGLGDLVFSTKTNGAGEPSSPRARITSSGDFIIGTSNPDIGGSVGGFKVNQSGKIFASTDTSLGIFYDEPLYLDRRDTSGDGVCIVLARHGYYKAGIGVLRGAGVSSEGSMAFFTGSNSGLNERIRIDPNGAFLINQLATSDYSSSIGHVFFNDGRYYPSFSANASGTEILLMANEITGGTCALIQYRTNYSAIVEGTIEGTSSGLAIINVSDYRKKQNVETLTGCLDRITNLRPVSYKLKPEYTQTPDKIVSGLIAHEVQEVMPDLVEGEKDAVYTQEDIDAGATGAILNAPKLQAVRYTSNEMIVNLIGAIKELRSELESAKNRIVELENK